MHSDDQLHTASRHLYYEVQQLIRAGQRLLNKQYPDPATQVFILEAWVLHLRCLMEFFWLGNRKGYVHASDYAEDWTEARPAKPEELFMRVNVLAAHISIERQTVLDDNRTWPYVNITNNMLAVLDQFESVARPGLLDIPTWRSTQKAGFTALDLL